MSIVDRWLLPDGVEDVLPPQAKQLEEVRRRLLDLFATWGYEYVIPPMIEYLESLLTGTGKDLDLKTFKIVDLLTGRTMGIRADITPQVARIDAHSLNRDGIVRLCYAGTVVQSQVETMLASRTPLSVGAELFGESSGKGDVEIVSLMVESLQSLGYHDIHLDLGDVAIFRQLVSALDISEDRRELLFDAVQKKAVAEIREQGAALQLANKDTNLLCALPGLTGDVSVLATARKLFTGHKGILACIDNLDAVAKAILQRFGGLDIYFDLGELRGYAYHTGIVFAAYTDGTSDIVAKGGRYDDIGRVFGRARSATGFSVNVRTLVEKTAISTKRSQRVFARPVAGKLAQAAWEEIQMRRREGYVVIESGQPGDGDLRLEHENGAFVLKPVSGNKVDE